MSTIVNTFQHQRMNTQRIGPSPCYAATPHSGFGPSHTAADLSKTPNLKIDATQRRWKMSPGNANVARGGEAMVAAVAMAA